MHNYTIFAQVIQEQDDGTMVPLGLYNVGETFEATDPEQAIKLFYTEGSGKDWTGDQEARLLGGLGLEYFSIAVQEVETNVIYIGHVHIEWGGDEYVRHIEIEPRWDGMDDPHSQPVVQSGAEAMGPR